MSETKRLVALAESVEPSLSQKHRELCALVDDATELRYELNKRAVRAAHDEDKDRIFGGLWGLLREKGWYAADVVQAAYAKSSATEQEKRSPLFDAATDEYWPEKLARHAQAGLGLDLALVNALLRINEAEEALHEAENRSINPKVLFGFILAAGALLANQVPKEAFQYFGWTQHTYERYRAYAFLALAVALCLAVALWNWWDALLGRASPQRHGDNLRRVEQVLEYLKATFESRTI